MQTFPIGLGVDGETDFKFSINSSETKFIAQKNFKNIINDLF